MMQRALAAEVTLSLSVEPSREEQEICTAEGIPLVVVDREAELFGTSYAITLDHKCFLVIKPVWLGFCGPRREGTWPTEMSE